MDFYILLEELLLELSPIEIYKKYYNNLSPRLFNKIVSSDPKSIIRGKEIQHIGKYVKLLITMYNNRSLKIEDLDRAKEYLSYVYKHQIPIDSSKIKNLSDLYNLVSKYIVRTNSDLKTILSSLNNDDYKLLFNGEKWIIFQPLTEKGACYLGVSSEWCTTWGPNSLSHENKDKDNRFEYYNTSGKLYIIINKTDEKEKYQFHFEDKQFMDSEDSQIDTGLFLSSNEELKYFFFPSFIKDVDEETNNFQLSISSILSDDDSNILLRKLLKLNDSDSPLIKSVINQDEELLKNSIRDKRVGEAEFIEKGDLQVQFKYGYSIESVRDTLAYYESDMYHSYDNMYDSFSDSEDWTNNAETYFKQFYDENISKINSIGIRKYERFKNTFFPYFIKEQKIQEEFVDYYIRNSEPSHNDECRKMIASIEKYIRFEESNYSGKKSVIFDKTNFLKYCGDKKILVITNIESFTEDYIDYYNVPTDYEGVYDFEYVLPTYIQLSFVIEKFFDKLIEEGEDDDENCYALREKLNEIIGKYFQNDDNNFKNEYVDVTINNDGQIDCEKGTVNISYKNLKTNETHVGDVHVNNLVSYVTNIPLHESHGLLNEQSDGIDDFINHLKKKFPFVIKFEEPLRKTILNSGCKKIEIHDIGFATGLALHDKVVFSPRAFIGGINYVLYVVFHEIAHQYQYKKYGGEFMYKIYQNEVDIDEAVKTLRGYETVADQFAMRKLREFLKLGLIQKWGIPTKGTYEGISDGHLKEILLKLRDIILKSGVTDVEKISETYYNYMVNLNEK